jgi:hypothetical protein
LTSFYNDAKVSPFKQTGSLDLIWTPHETSGDEWVSEELSSIRDDFCRYAPFVKRQTSEECIPEQMTGVNLKIVFGKRLSFDSMFQGMADKAGSRSKEMTVLFRRPKLMAGSIKGSIPKPPQRSRLRRT